MRASQQSNFISPSGTCAAFATGLRDGFTEEEVRSNALPHPGLLPKERRIALSLTGTRAAGSAGQSFPSQKAVLKTRAVQTLRDGRASSNCAKRLECGVFTAAFLADDTGRENRFPTYGAARLAQSCTRAPRVERSLKRSSGSRAVQAMPLKINRRKRGSSNVHV